LDPAGVAEGQVAALLEAERADVELDRPVLVGDGNGDRSHGGDVGGPWHRGLLGSCRSPEGRSWRASLDMQGEDSFEVLGGGDEVPGPDLQQPGIPGDLGGVLRGRAGGRLPLLQRPHRGAGRLGGADRLRGPDGRLADQEGVGARRPDADQRRAVRRGQGAAGRLLPAGVRHPRAGGRGGRPGARGRARAGRGPARPRAGRDGDVSPPTSVNDLLRELAPRVLGGLVRRYGDFATCEDAVQEALLAAALQWPAEGVPANPAGWLSPVAPRRWVQRARQGTPRRRREQTAAVLAPPDPGPVPASDDTLTLLLLCCHPSLTQASRVALTLRAVGGLTTAEIARAFLVPEATRAQPISRAKQRIKASGAGFRLPAEAERGERLAAVLQVLYLIFNEGYTASSGTALHRVELTGEAIRLTRQLHARLPADGGGPAPARTGPWARWPSGAGAAGTPRPSPRGSP